MSNKSYQNSLFKRIIDLGKVTSADVDDLVRIWRVGSGDEKAITLANFVATVNEDLGSGGSSLTELIEALQLQVDNLTFLDLTDTESTYTGSELLYPRVNSLGTGLEFFNVLNNLLTGYTLGSNTALASTDTILGAFGKVQGQINARVSGTGVLGRVSFWNSVTAINSSDQLLWDDTNKVLQIGSVGSVGSLRLDNRVSSFFTGVPSNIYTIKDAIIPSPLNGTGSLIIQSRASDTTGVAIVTGATPSIKMLIGINTVGILTTSPTNTLDVNGTARIRTINNLGTSATEVLVPSATGVVSKRTLAEFLADGSAITGTIASGQVAFGTGVNTVGGSGNLTFNSSTGVLNVGPAFFGSERLSVWGNIQLTQDGTGIIIDSGNNKRVGFFKYNGFAGGVISRISTAAFSIGRLGTTTITDSTGFNSDLFFSSTGLIGVQTTSPTNTLDVNGTARIRTISNLGVSATKVLVPDATGVVSLRTATQFLADAGGISGTIASGQVAFGTGVNTVGGDANMTYTTGRLTINRFADTRITLQDNGTTTLLLQALSTAGRISGSNTNLPIEFWTGGIYRWGVIQAGILQSNGSQTIRTSTGNLTLATAGGNGNIFLTPNGTGIVGILTTSPTNTLDVNGTARIRTINNLGTSATNVLVPDATGVVSLRTATQFLADAGGISGTIASGQVAFGTGVNTVGGDSGLTWDNVNKVLTSTKTFDGLQVINSQNINSGVNSRAGFSALSDVSSLLIVANSSTYNGGIGFSSGTSIFTGINSSGGLSLLSRNVSGIISFHTGGNTERARITSSGLLGIATTSPTNTIDVNGTARIRTLSNATGDFVTASATGVLQKRTAAEVATDIGAVTITGTQTITGEKTFSNALLIQEASAPVLRLKTTNDTQATINFRNISNEDEAGLQFDAGVGKFSLLTRVNNCDIEIAPHGTGSILLPNVPSGSGSALGVNGSNELVKISSFSSYKLLDEDITPTSFTSTTFATILTEGIIGTNSFDGATDASYEGELWIRSVDDASSTFDLRFSIWGQNIDVNISLGSGSQTWNTFVRFKLIIQSGSFLLNGQSITMLENSNFENVKNINHSMTTYTATSTSSLDIQARCLGTGTPTLYPTSFVLKQIA